jgi:hypothetical protein
MYLGIPLLVLRLISATESDHPKPNVPFPLPESYVRLNDGPNPDRPGEVRIGMLIVAVPVTGFAANFSPRERMEPPDVGSEILGRFESERVDFCGSLVVLLGVSGFGIAMVVDGVCEQRKSDECSVEDFVH